MGHFLILLVGFLLIAGCLVAASIGIWRWAFPKRETSARHRIPHDIKQWSQPTPDPVGKHYVDHTSEFSAIPHGQNRHFVDVTSEMSLSSRTDTVAMRAVKPDAV